VAIKIGELLVQNGLITKDQLDHALQAQIFHGGRVGSSLIELGFISTAALAEFLARQLNLPAMVPSQLNEIHPKALAAVDPELAARHMIVPLSLEKRKLQVAMADPTDVSAVDDLAFRTGYQVIPIVAPEVLIEYALEKFYHVRRPNRFLNLAANLDVQPAEEWPEIPTPGGESPKPAVEPPKPLVARPKAQVPTEHYGPREAAADLVDCTSNSDVLSILKRYLLRDFQRVAICVVDGESLRPLTQSGCTLPPEMPRDGIGKPRIALTYSVLCQAASSCQGPSFEPTPDAPSDRLLVKLLDPAPDEHILVFPIQIAKRVEMVAFATGARSAEAEGPLEARAAFATKTSQAIQLVRLRRAILSP
jgi:hypothetical protein